MTITTPNTPTPTTQTVRKTSTAATVSITMTLLTIRRAKTSMTTDIEEELSRQVRNNNDYADNYNLVDIENYCVDQFDDKNGNAGYSNNHK